MTKKSRPTSIEPQMRTTTLRLQRGVPGQPSDKPE